MKSYLKIAADSDVDHLEAVAISFSSQIGMRLCSESIGRQNRFPQFHAVLYTHFKNIQNSVTHSRLNAHGGPDILPPEARASEVMGTAKCLAASANRWPDSAGFDLEDLQALFERAQQLGGTLEQADSWAEVVSALAPRSAPAELQPAAENPPVHGFDWKSKRQQVKRIEAAARWHCVSPGKGPRDSVALGFALTVLFLGLIAPKGLAGLGFTPSLPWPWLGTVLSVLAAVGAYIVVLVYGPGPRSYSDVLYASLAAYAPIDKDAYRVLQAKTRRYVEFDYFQAWASSERQAIAEAAGLMKAKTAFLEKAV